MLKNSGFLVSEFDFWFWYNTFEYVFFAFQIQSDDSSSIKYCCDFCNKSFFNKGSRNRHVKNIHLQIRSWQCEFCNAKFKQGSTLKHHVLAKHKKIKPWNCKLCEMTFTQKSNLTTHERKLHKNPSYNQSLVHGINDGRKSEDSEVKIEIDSEISETINDSQTSTLPPVHKEIKQDIKTENLNPTHTSAAKKSDWSTSIIESQSQVCTNFHSA